MHRLTITLLIVCVASLSLPPVSLADEPAELPFRISPETTYFTEPLNEDGTVNYLAAVNAIYSEGVTPDNNAAALLLRIAGARAIPSSNVDEPTRQLRVALGIVDLPYEGLYVDPAEYWPADPDKRDAAQKRFDAAMAGPWRRQQSPEVAAWLAANEQTLALAMEASQRERHFVPWVQSVGQSDEPRLVSAAIMLPMSTYRGLAKLLVCRAYLRLGEGDVDGAFEDSCTAYRLGALTSQQPALIDQLVATVIASIACETMWNVVAADLNAGQARAMLTTWQALPPEPAPWRAVGQCERLFVLDAVCWYSLRPESITTMFSRMLLNAADNAAAHDPTPEEIAQAEQQVQDVLALIDWDQLLRGVNAHFDQLVAVMRGPIAERSAHQDEVQTRLNELDVLNPPAAMRATGADSGDVITTWATDVALYYLGPAAIKVQALADRVGTRHELVAIALALAVYRAESGGYPDGLDALSPDIIDEVGFDSFSGEPYVYERTDDGYVLYSVGMDLTDDGGSDDDDIVIRVGQP